MNEHIITNNFIAFLVSKKGFPQAVLRSDFGLIEAKTAETLRPDLVILDPNRSGFMAVVEFVASEDKLDSHQERCRILRDRAALGKVRRAAYLVAPSKSAPYEFLIRQVFDEFKDKKISENEFPSFQDLLMGETAKWKAEKDQETEVAVDSFKKWCWALAVVVFVLFLLDILKVITLNTEQLALLGLATGLALTPYAAKFKFLGIEWERHKAESAKDDLSDKVIMQLSS